MTVINQGTGAGDGGSLEVWTDQADPQVCGTRGNAFASVGTLAPGDSRTLTLTGLRSGAVGAKTLRAFVDGGCEAREADDTNNQSTLTYNVAAAVADFVVTGGVLTPIKPIAGTSFRAAVTVRNLGRGAGAPRTLRLWPNLATAPACGATGGSTIALPTLAAGASTTVTLTGLGAGAAAGNRTLRAFVDPACLTGETNETNNQFTLAYSVNGPAPDFVVTAASLSPTGPVANRTFDATLTVRNQGTAAGVPGSLRVWANRTDAPACGTAAEKSASLTASLAPGASTSVTVRGLPAGAAGTKSLRAFIEADCKVSEVDETNNQFTRAYRVFPRALPDFAVTALVPTPASPRAGAAFSVAVTVRNLGAAGGDGGYLDLWAQDPGARTCGASGHVYGEVGALAAGESRTLTLRGLRAGAAGAAALRAFVDSACDTAEAEDTNNQATQAYTVAR